MEIRNFITFRKIVELGSFTKASEVLGYAQSTITSHIQQIEAYYGRPVFERLGHTLILTNLGNALLDETEVLLESYLRIERLGSDNKSNHITIKIGAEETILLYKLENLFKDYKSICPEVEIVLINEPYQFLEKRLDDGSVDIIFIIDKMVKKKDYVITVIDDEPMMFVSSPDYQRNRDNKTYRLPKIITTRKGGTYSSLFETYLREKKIVHEHVMEAWSLELVKQSLILGMGVAFLPMISVLNEIESGQLIGDPVNLSEKNTIYSQMIYHKNKQLNAPISTLIQLVEKR
jgi:DNA-binding transcriptional LysR family regulator